MSSIPLKHLHTRTRRERAKRAHSLYCSILTLAPRPCSLAALIQRISCKKYNLLGTVCKLSHGLMIIEYRYTGSYSISHSHLSIVCRDLRYVQSLAGQDWTTDSSFCINTLVLTFIMCLCYCRPDPTYKIVSLRDL